MFRFVISSIRITLLAGCLCLVHPGLVLSQEDAESEQRESILLASASPDSLANSGSTVLLPVLGYTPDTGLMLGGTILRFFYLEPEYADSRPSVFSPVFIYTLKNQIMIFMGLGLNWDQDRNALELNPHFIKFPNQFYGIGRDVSIDDEEDFTSETLGLGLDYSRRVWHNWRVGLSYLIMKHRLTETDPAGQLNQGHILGSENSILSGLGPALVMDSRENTWNPYQGWFLSGTARFGGSALGSDYTLQEYNLDLRGYFSLGEKTVLAGQYLTTRFEGETPFYVMPRLGGDDGLRGYRGGLYMDTTRAFGRMELRRRAILGPFGAVAFAGIGDVAPSPGKLTLAGNLWSAGFGIRYLLDENERINIRLDFGFGNGDSGFYLSLGEAF